MSWMTRTSDSSDAATHADRTTVRRVVPLIGLRRLEGSEKDTSRAHRDQLSLRLIAFRLYPRPYHYPKNELREPATLSLSAIIPPYGSKFEWKWPGVLMWSPEWMTAL
jgi:hypothetical protein